MDKTCLKLTENFLQYFNIALALTPEQKRDVYRIRYNVYCREYKYEPAECFPDGEESDEFDAQSLHCLITHRASLTPAACVRLITPTGRDSQDLLPFEKYCSESLDKALIEALELNRHTVCELSRFTVDSGFRRRVGKGEARYRDVEGRDYTKQEQRALPMTRETGVSTTWMAVRANVLWGHCWKLLALRLRAKDWKRRLTVGRRVGKGNH